MGTHPIFESDFDSNSRSKKSVNMSAWNALPPTGGGGAVTGAGNDEWAEHKAPNGRIYYFNKLTQKSVWVKPESMMTAGEKHLANCPWKSHKNTDGKMYFYNTVTKASSWQEPDELKKAKKEAENIDAQSQQAGAGGNGQMNPAMMQMMMMMMMNQQKKKKEKKQQQQETKVVEEPVYETKEDAKIAFKQ